MEFAKSIEFSRYHAGIEVVGDSPSKRTVTPRKRNNVALVGFGITKHDLRALNSSEWEVWALNMANRIGIMKDNFGDFRADRWFDLHPLSVQSFDDMEWIEYCPIPIYLTEPYPINKNAVVYPLADVIAKWERYAADTFASSFAYMMALAMMEGFKKIGVYGCDLDWGRERVVEHGNLCFWVGLARGLGFDVDIPDHSILNRHPARYGFDYWKEREAIEDRNAKLILELLGDKRIRKKFFELNAWVRNLPNDAYI